MDFPINYELRIMNYKGVHKGSPLRSNSNSTDVFYPTIMNYELRIMNYKSILAIHKHFQQRFIEFLHLLKVCLIVVVP